MSVFPRLDILPSSQRTLWPELAAVSRHSFVLYGGTAVALYLGHRESVDFDFFTNRPFQPDELFADYNFLHNSEVLQSQPNTLTDEALRDLPGDLEERLLSAIKSVRSIPTAVLNSTALND